MATDDAERLLKGIGTLLEVFLVNEDRFPTAGGKARYNPIDFATLRYVQTYPGCRGADIARHLKVAATTQQSVLDRLIRRGLVVRRDHPDGGGAKAHHLTEEGQAMRDAIHAQDIANMNAMLAIIGPDDRQTVLNAIDKIADVLGKESSETG
jgi:DNA-binding MarR family transcriptional regulator